MIRQVLLAMASLTLLWPPSTAGNGSRRDSQPLVAQDLLTKLRNRDVGRVEILWMRKSILTRYPYAGEDLERSYEVKIVLSDITEAPWFAGLLSSLERTSATHIGSRPNVRLGIVFFDRQTTQRIVGIYFDKDGGTGAIDDAAAAISGDLFSLLSGFVANCQNGPGPMK